VIVHKELFQFPNELFTEIGTGFDVSPAVSIFFDCDDAIVSDLFLLVALLALDNANRAAFEDAPWKGGFIHQHQYVNGVTIVGFGRGNKSEVVRKGHTSRQNFLQFENVIVNVKSKLVAASFRSLDDDLKHLFVSGIERLKSRGICKSGFLFCH
jgi:hypothetical protein